MPQQEDTLVSLYSKLSKMAVVPHKFSDFLIPKEDLNILDMVNYSRFNCSRSWGDTHDVNFRLITL